MSEPATETSTPEEGPASLREALQASFEEAIQEESPAEPVVTDDEPTDDDSELATSEAQEADDEPSEGQPQGEQEVISAPEHWSAENKALFDSASREAQDAWLQREKEYEQGIQAKADELKPLKEAFGQYRDVLKLRGIDEATAIRTWTAAQSMLDADPVNGLKMLIQQFPVTVKDQLLQQFGQADAQTFDTDDTDPEIADLRRQLRESEQRSQQYQSQMRTDAQQEAMTKVKNFREATDEGGALLHPHFEKVSGYMQALISSGQAKDLEAAYDEAVWTLPEYRQEFADKEAKAAEKAEAKKREEAAKKAKKTATTVTGKSSTPPPPAQPKTLRDELAEAWNQSVKGEL